MTKKSIIPFCIITLCLLCSCGKTGSQESSADKKDTLQEIEADTEKTAENKTTIPSAEEIAKKLQGKWQSVDDAKSFIEFKGEFHTDIYDNEAMEKEKFTISKSCPDTDNPNLKSEKAEFLVVGDMCWFIEQVDEHDLVLNYTSRGNTLRYKKVK